MEVIKWTFYGDEEYPEAEGNDNQEECEDAIVREIQKWGYRFTGPAHQHHPYTVPVLSDGTRYECSFRYWGGIMARALGLDGPHAYVTWAFQIPKGQEEVLPKPEDWGEKETEEHLQAFEATEKRLFNP